MEKNKSKERILITGGSGFLGKNVLNHLQNIPIKKIFVIKHKQKIQKKNSQIKEIKCNLLNKNETEKIIKKIKPSIIIHCAWNIDHKEYQTSLKNLEWLNATLNIAKAFQNIQGKKFIFIGSIYENFNITKNAHTLIEKTLYGLSKKAAYELLQHFFKKNDIIFQHVRPSFIIGPGEQSEKLISSTIKKIISKKNIECKNPNFEIDFIHVYDVSEIICKLALEKNESITINASSGKKTKLLSVFKEICKEMNYPKQKIIQGSLEKKTAYLKNNLKEIPYVLKYNVTNAIEDIKKEINKNLGKHLYCPILSPVKTRKNKREN